MKKKKKMKKKVKVTLIIVIILILLIIGGLCYYWFFYNKNDNEVKIVNKIKGYGYVLKDSKSKKYKELFNKLDKVLEKDPVDEEKYVKLISRMFLLDFYSLDEKVAKTDVGGVDFVYGDAVTDFLENSEDTVYKYVESDLYKQRKQTLPVVTDVVIDEVKKEEFTYGDKIDSDAYLVKATLKYKHDKNMGYPKTATLRFVHDGKKLSLVEAS